MEIVKIDHTTGMRKGVPRGSEMRGKDKIYDPWLRIPNSEVESVVKKMVNKYPNIDQIVTDVNNSGASHINRVFFDKIWKKVEDKDSFAKHIIKRCTPKVNVFFLQFYAHRLYQDKRYDECYDLLQRSVNMAKTFPDQSWDKWVVSGHFFNARYHTTKEDKARYCIATLLEPRTLNYSPHLKYWKIFRAAAWLVGNGMPGQLAMQGIERYKSLNFDGYMEIRGGDKSVYSTVGVLDDPKKCLALMTNDVAHHYLGDP